MSLSLFQHQGRIDLALDLYEEALYSKKMELPHYHPTVASILYEVGQAYEAGGKYELAIKYFKEVSSEIRRKILVLWSRSSPTYSSKLLKSI